MGEKTNRIKELKEIIASAQEEISELQNYRCLHYPLVGSTISVNGEAYRWHNSDVQNEIRNFCKLLGSAHFGEDYPDIIEYSKRIKMKDLSEDRIKILNEFIAKVSPIIAETVKQILEAD